MPETEGDLMIGMSYSGYEGATGELPIPMGVSVYLDGDVSDDQYEAVALKAKQVINNYSDSFILRDTYGYLYRTIEREKETHEFGIMLSLLILLLSPIVWFYSQSLFYKKRKKEMYVLSAYGATAKVFKKIHTTSGILLSAVGFVFTVILSLGANYLIFKTMNEWIVYLGFGSGVRYEMRVSVPALILCLIVSALCGFISSYLPYRSAVGKGDRKLKKSNSNKDNDNNDNEIEGEN
jgi:ABC-type lipoprotein release transport system permease subunit